MKSSVVYASPTRRPVKTSTLAMLSRCFAVIMCLRFITLRTMMSSVSTIAKPLKIAPATKYGGKMVVCQPGMTLVAKSKDTTVCTETTRGVAIPARMRLALS